MDSRKNLELQFTHACAELCNFLEQELPSLALTKVPTFRRIRKYSDLEVRTFEAELGIGLPEAYRYFLQVVGASEVFVDKYGLGYTFYALEDLWQFHQRVFRGMQCPFPILFLISSDSGTGCAFGFDLSHGSVHRNFASFSPDANPERWVSETTDWFSFEEWFSALVSFGEAP